MILGILNQNLFLATEREEILNKDNSNSLFEHFMGLLLTANIRECHRPNIIDQRYITLKAELGDASLRKKKKKKKFL